MSEVRFEWDEAKNRENRRKHRVSFEEAQTVFLDENAVRFFDPDHSADEDRFLMLGISFQLRVLVVCHCIREGQRHPHHLGAQGRRERRGRLLECEVTP
jgi:uncharacterized protein